MYSMELNSEKIWTYNIYKINKKFTSLLLEDKIKKLDKSANRLTETDQIHKQEKDKK